MRTLYWQVSSAMLSAMVCSKLLVEESLLLHEACSELTLTMSVLLMLLASEPSSGMAEAA